MELKTAIEILDYHQEWRLGKRDDMIHEPKKLTEALDMVLSEVKKLPIHIVSNRSFNELELLAEDLECVKMLLDNKDVPTHDEENNQYSVVGRIELLLNGC